jgi:hypothetical protein
MISAGFAMHTDKPSADASEWVEMTQQQSGGYVL